MWRRSTRPLGRSRPAERRWPPPALRVRPFRWYWAAQWPTLLGTWMQVVALGYLVYQRTGSTTAVAAVAAADGIPSVILSLAGGVLADRLPRRRILLVTQSLLGLSAGSLALLVATHHASFAAILVVAIVFGATDAADLPTRQALVADLVDRHLVVNAVALGAAAMSATRIVGPSVAGLLIGFAGPAVCFGFLAVAYLAPIAVLLTVIPDVAPLPRRAGATAWGELIAGLRVAGVGSARSWRRDRRPPCSHSAACRTCPFCRFWRERSCTSVRRRSESCTASAESAASSVGSRSHRWGEEPDVCS